MMEACQLDKKKLNNYIVSMRNDVKRSIVHTINGLSRQAKQLRKRNGTDEQKAKNNKKAERLVQEIMVIKELNKDEVAKFGLTTIQDLNHLQGNMKAPVKIRLMARLCMHKFIQAKIKEFKNQYPISGGQVLKILRTKKSKLKKLKSAVSKDISEKKERDISNRTREKYKKVNDSENKSEQLMDFNISESESDDDNIISEEEMDSVSEENDKPDVENVNDEKVDEEEDQISNTTFNSGENNKKPVHVESVKSHLLKDNNSKKEKKKLKKIDNSSKDLELSSDEQGSAKKSNDVDLDSKNIKIKNKLKKETEGMKAVDPFFITKENKEYITAQVPVVSGIPEKDFSKFEKRRKFGTDGTKLEQNENSSFSKNETSSFQSFTKHKVDRNNALRDGFDDRFKNRRERRLNLHKHIDKPKQKERNPKFDFQKREGKFNKRDMPQMINSKPKVEKLHPSWEAKKKLTSIAEFQGKKIKFDD